MQGYGPQRRCPCRNPPMLRKRWALHNTGPHSYAAGGTSENATVFRLVNCMERTKAPPRLLRGKVKRDNHRGLCSRTANPRPMAKKGNGGVDYACLTDEHRTEPNFFNQPGLLVCAVFI